MNNGSDVYWANEKYKQDCAAGKNEACPGGTKGMVAWGVAGVVTAGLAEYAILGGGVADGVAGATKPLQGLVENGFRQAAVMCLKNPLCARMIGAGSGVTVLGKIIEGEEPPGYVKIGQQINGRYLYVNMEDFTSEMQDKFWNETKALGNPILLANDYNQFEGSTFFHEVTDLIDSGWTIILNILAYPPKQ
jgi:hypothetical protein